MSSLLSSGRPRGRSWAVAAVIGLVALAWVFRRWPSVFVFDQIAGPVHDIAPDGTQLPPNRDVMQALQAWDGQGCFVVTMAPQPLGRVHNASGKTIHGIRIEMKMR